MLMLVSAIRACEKSRFWRLVQRMLIFRISDRDGGNGTLIKAMYRDGMLLGSSWWQLHWILDVGIIYYVYLFGRSW